MQSGRDRDKEATNKIEQNDKDYNFIIGLHHYLTYNPPMVLSGEKKILTQIYKALAPTNLSDFFYHSLLAHRTPTNGVPSSVSLL